MVNNLKLGDTYYTIDGYNEVTEYLFVAQQGQFIIGSSEYFHCAGNVIEQLNEMSDETLENEGVDMYVHRAENCYPTLEEAESNLDER